MWRAVLIVGSLLVGQEPAVPSGAADGPGGPPDPTTG